MPKHLLLLPALICTVMGASSAWAQNISPQQQLEVLFKAPSVAQFDPAFLKAVPFEQITGFIKKTLEQYGKVQKIEVIDETDFRIFFEKGTFIAQASLSKTGQFTSLALSSEVGPSANTLEQVQSVLDTLWATPKNPEIYANSTFASQVAPVVLDIQKKMGKIVSVRAVNLGSFLIRLERGNELVNLELNEQGQIASIYFIESSLDNALKMLKALPGKTSVVIVQDGKTRLEQGVKEPLATGSSFKMAVLNAAQQAVTSGKLKWETPITLKAEDFVVSSSVPGKKKAGETLSLREVADAMIQVSDNTAADTLIRLLGRESIEKYILPRNIPLMTTKNMFELKHQNNTKLLEEFRKSTLEKKRAIFQKIDTAMPTPDLKLDKPTALDLEWYFTPLELCNLMNQVQDNPSMQINSGIAVKADWTQVAFKGGSEAGVISLTTYLKSRLNKRYCVSATWNDSKNNISEAEFFTMYQIMLLNLEGKN
jgi:beta-lactamase class A